MAQTQTFNGRRRVRKFFGKIPEVAEMPNLVFCSAAFGNRKFLPRSSAGSAPYHRRSFRGSMCGNSASSIARTFSSSASQTFSPSTLEV